MECSRDECDGAVESAAIISSSAGLNQPTRFHTECNKCGHEYSRATDSALWIHDNGCDTCYDDASKG